MIAKAFVTLYLVSGLLSIVYLVGLVILVGTNYAGLTDLRLSAMPFVALVALMLTSKIIGGVLLRRSQHG